MLPVPQSIILTYMQKFNRFIYKNIIIFVYLIFSIRQVYNFICSFHSIRQLLVKRKTTFLQNKYLLITDLCRI
jgi:hypothetical protein